MKETTVVRRWFVAMGLAMIAVLGQALPASAVERPFPYEWDYYEDPPVEWGQVVDVATSAPPTMVGEYGLLQPGQTIEVRVKLAQHNVPSTFADLHVTLVQIVDAQGEATEGPAWDLGIPEVDNQEVWTQYTVPSALGGAYVLALTADPAAGQPGYLIGGFVFVVVPAASDPSIVTDPIDAGAVLPPPPPAPPAPVPPAPAPAPVAPPPAPVAPAASAAPVAPAPAPPAEPAPAPAADTAVPPSQPEVSAPVAASAPSDYPTWLLPGTVGVAVVAVAGAVVWRIVEGARRSASMRRLSNRP